MLLLLGVGQWGELALACFFRPPSHPPPYPVGGAGLNSRAPPVCTHKRPCRGSCSLGVAGDEVPLFFTLILLYWVSQQCVRDANLPPYP